MPTLNDLVGANSGGLPDRLSSGGTSAAPDTETLIAQLVDLQNQQNALAQQRQELPDAQQQLTSVPGLLALLGGGAAAAFGGSEGALAGAGLVEGFIGGAQDKTTRANVNLAQQQDQLADILDKQRQRLTTLLQSRPEMFIDAGTGESLIDPRVLGIASTGFALPIDPGVNYTLTKQTQNQKMLVEVGMNLMLNGDTPDKRKQGGLIITNQLGLDIDDGFIETVMGQDEASAWQSLYANNNLDTQHTLNAHHRALTNGLSLSDPEIVGMLAPAIKPGHKVTIPDRVLSLTQEYSTALRELDPSVWMPLSLPERFDYVFGGDREGDALILKNAYDNNNAFGSGISGRVIFDSMLRSGDMDMMLFSMNPNMDKFTSRGITDADGVWQNVGENVAAALPYALQAQADVFAHDKGNKQRLIEGKLFADNPDATDSEVAIEASRILAQLQAAATDNNRTDAAKFTKLVEDFLKGEGNE